MKDHDTPPSDAFMEAICDAGSIVIECELCGRVHFATYNGGGDFEEGELEGLRAHADKEPDKYLEDASCSSISWGYIENKQAVYGCPCNQARKYEVWVWEHRRIIIKYLKTRIMNAKRAAELEEELFEGITESAAALLLEWLKQRGRRVDGNFVFNGSFWSRVESVDITKVKVGTLVVDVHNPRSFQEVDKYLVDGHLTAKSLVENWKPNAVLQEE